MELMEMSQKETPLPLRPARIQKVTWEHRSESKTLPLPRILSCTSSSHSQVPSCQGAGQMAGSLRGRAFLPKMIESFLKDIV